jgi:hypothetical protein
LKQPTVRNAEPRDVPAIEARHREQNQRDGTNYPLPKLFDEQGKLMPNIDLALVIEQDGEVLQGIVFEHISEMQCYGCDPRATAVGRHDIDGAMYLLQSQGIKVALCAVPLKVVGPVSKPLNKAKFKRRDDLAHFYRETKP